jgi:hypothetical protein
MMRVAITHLTRMRNGHVCVAGVDIATLRHVRPVLATRQLGVRELARRGGPFDLATVVDLGGVTPTPSRPAVEDHRFNPWEAAALVPIPAPAYWDLLGQLARTKLRAIFGAPLQPHGVRGAAIPEGTGGASLGCLRPTGRPRLRAVAKPDGSAALRMWLSDGEVNASVSVTDLRLYQADRETPDLDAVSLVQARLDAGQRVLLSVGLTRAFAKSGEAAAHWLQVNNVHFESEPAWRLADGARPSGERHDAPTLRMVGPSAKPPVPRDAGPVMGARVGPG